MIVVGMLGGSSLVDIGRVQYVGFFFACARVFHPISDPDYSSSAILDQLYKRYIRVEELVSAQRFMAKLHERFSTITCRHALVATRLENADCLSDATIGDHFGRLFRALAHCIESARLNYEAFEGTAGYTYEAPRIVIASQPWFQEDHRRPLAEYDRLEGEPFWLRAGE